MSSSMVLSLIPPYLAHHRNSLLRRPNYHRKHSIFRCNLKKQTDTKSEETNPLLKLAWYSSELLGIAASFIKAPKTIGDDKTEEAVFSKEFGGVVDRVDIVGSIKEDFQRSYFVTGNLTLNAYEEDCEFADPASSFKGLRRFKRNCSNFGSLVERSDMKLMKWEDLEDKWIGHWRFSCILSFPWKPILSATGYTEYFFDPQSGRVCRHVEHWNVPKIALFKQILRPTKGLRTKITKM